MGHHTVMIISCWYAKYVPLITKRRPGDNGKNNFKYSLLYVQRIFNTDLSSPYSSQSLTVSSANHGWGVHLLHLIDMFSDDLSIVILVQCHWNRQVTKYNLSPSQSNHGFQTLSFRSWTYPDSSWGFCWCIWGDRCTCQGPTSFSRTWCPTESKLGWSSGSNPWSMAVRCDPAVVVRTTGRQSRERGWRRTWDRRLQWPRNFSFSSRRLFLKVNIVPSTLYSGFLST